MDQTTASARAVIASPTSRCHIEMFMYCDVTINMNEFGNAVGETSSTLNFKLSRDPLLCTVGSMWVRHI